MGLRDIGAALPPGFRFYPSDEELVCHYLYKKITNEEILKGTLVEIDLHTCEPWLLPEVAKLNANEWYFFSFRDRKYATGYRTNRATTCGYWKATGKDRTVVDPARNDQVVGMRKTLVFYKNRAPHGIKTGWIMHEFRLETPHMPPKEDWVLCRVFHKSKAETMSSEQLSPQYIFDSTANASSFPSSPAATLSCRLINNNVPLGLGYHHYQISSPPQPPPPPAPDSHTQNLTSNSMLNLLRSPSLQDLKTSSGIGRIISPKGDDHDHDHDHDHDDYAFMWEMEMDLHDNCSSLDRSIDNNGAVASNLGDVGFELGNSMVFI